MKVRLIRKTLASFGLILTISISTPAKASDVFTLCQTLLSSSPEEFAHAILEAYRGVLFDAGTDLITDSDLEHMLKTKDYFQIAETGSSSRDHIRTALRQIREALEHAGKTAFPAPLDELIRSELSVRRGVSKTTKEEREKHARTHFIHRIELPEIAPSTFDTNVLAVSRRGTTALIRQNGEHTAYLLITTGPDKSPEPRVLQIPEEINRDFRYYHPPQFSEDGSLLSIVLVSRSNHDREKAFLFDARTGALIQEYPMAGYSIKAVISHDDKRIILRVSDFETIDWYAGNIPGGAAQKLPTPQDLQEKLTRKLRRFEQKVIFSEDGLVAGLQVALDDDSGVLHHFIVFWDLANRDILDSLHTTFISAPPNWSPSAIVFSADGKTALVPSPLGIKIRDFRNHVDLHTLRATTTPHMTFRAFAFSKDSKLIASAYPEQGSFGLLFFNVWSADTGEIVLPRLQETIKANTREGQIDTLEFNDDYLLFSSVSPNATSRYALRLSDGKIGNRYFDRVWPGPENKTMSSNDASMHVEVDGKSLKVWNLGELVP